MENMADSCQMGAFIARSDPKTQSELEGDTRELGQELLLSLSLSTRDRIGSLGRRNGSESKRVLFFVGSGVIWAQRSANWHGMKNIHSDISLAFHFPLTAVDGL